MNTHINLSDWTFWISPNINNDEAEQIAASLRRLDRVTAISYQFSSPRGFFDKIMRVNNESLGLTCATFVLAVFDAIKIEIVKLNTWPIRTDDADRRARICVSLTMTPVERSAVQMETGTPTYRPLEVAGAAARYKYPVHFKKAIRYSRRLLALWPN
jgi:hypothetical protein